MFTVALIALGVPSLLGVFAVGMRRRSEGRLADRRGIALQTVIIMVVLLVIAGAIAAVLLARGGTATVELERQEVARTHWDYQHKNLCIAAGYSWRWTRSYDHAHDTYSTITTATDGCVER